MNLTLEHSEWNIFLRDLTSSTHPGLFSVLTNTMALPLLVYQGKIWYDYNKYNTEYYSPDIIHLSWSVLSVNKHHGAPSVNVSCIWYDYNKYNTEYYSPDVIHPSWSVLSVIKNHGPPSVNVRLYLV